MTQTHKNNQIICPSKYYPITPVSHISFIRFPSRNTGMCLTFIIILFLFSLYFSFLKFISSCYFSLAPILIMNVSLLSQSLALFCCLFHLSFLGESLFTPSFASLPFLVLFQRSHFLLFALSHSLFFHVPSFSHYLLFSFSQFTSLILFNSKFFPPPFVALFFYFYTLCFIRLKKLFNFKRS